jgi:hypothetical protein
MVEKSAILSHYPVEEVSTIKYLKQLGELPSRYEYDAAAGTTKRFKGLDRGFGDMAILGKRAVIVGSQVGKVHSLSGPTFDREYLRPRALRGFGEALLAGLTKVAAANSLLLNKSSVDHIFSSTMAIHEDPPTGIC